MIPFVGLSGFHSHWPSLSQNKSSQFQYLTIVTEIHRSSVRGGACWNMKLTEPLTDKPALSQSVGMRTRRNNRAGLLLALRLEIAR